MNLSQEESKRFNKRRKVFLAVIAFLLLVNGFFFFNQIRVKRKMQEIELKKQELDSIYSATLNDLKTFNDEIDNLKGINYEYDSLLQLHIAEIKIQRDSIAILLKKDELNTFEIYKLRKWVETLREESYQYWEAAQQLNHKLEQNESISDSLRLVAIQGKTENENLLFTQNELKNKIQLASVLKPSNIKISGIKVRRNGNETYTNLAKKSDKILICFDVPENKLSAKESKAIIIRILNPLGSTVSNSEKYIHIVDDTNSGHPIPYSLSIDFEYEGKEKTICTYWQQSTSFSKGIYKIEFYQDQYFLCESELHLK